MDKVSTSSRIKQIMQERNLKQRDILELAKPLCKKYNIKLERNDLSQYVSGKVEPGQNKLTILSKALNVNPVWLMGYNVPMNFDNDIPKNEYDKQIEKIALELGGNIYIDKKRPLTLKDVEEINKILLDIVNKQK